MAYRVGSLLRAALDFGSTQRSPTANTCHFKVPLSSPSSKTKAKDGSKFTTQNPCRTVVDVSPCSSPHAPQPEVNLMSSIW